MPLRGSQTKQVVELPSALETAGRSPKAAAFSGFAARLSVLVRSFRLQKGFSLIESVAALGLIGIAVVGSVVLLGATVRTSANTQGDVSLVQLVRAQVETIQNVAYNDDPGQYPLLEDVPPNVSITFEATDQGARYQVNGADLGQVVQQIEVMATKDGRTASLTFLKIKSAGLPTPTPIPLPTATPTVAPPPAADSLEFDIVKAADPNMIPTSGNFYAIAYSGNGDDGFLTIVEMAAGGRITEAVIDTLEFDAQKGQTPSIVPISGNIYAIAYAGDGDDGFLKTVEIASSGQITDALIDTLEFDTQKGKTPDIIPISGDVYAIAYAGNGDDGFLKTVEISAHGQITDAVIDTLEFDAQKGQTPNIIPISGDVYGIAYAGNDNNGFLKTVQIAANGQIADAVIDTLEFDSLKGQTPGIIPVAGDVYAIAYSGNDNNGFLKTVQIAANGQIADAVIDTLEFDAQKGQTPDIIPISGDVYAIAYAGNGDDGFLTTVQIAANGQITDAVIDTLEFDTQKGKTPNILHVSGVVYAVAYAGSGDDGFLKTILITASGQIKQ